MTRINLVKVKELSDQHLIAEYHELPRAIKQDIDLSDAPDKYCLGTGHVKWAKKHSLFLFDRYMMLCEEMRYRGFQVNYPWENLYKEYKPLLKKSSYYIVSLSDMFRSKQRLKEKYNKMPEYYTWTKRKKPRWLTNKYISIIGEQQ